MTVTKEALQRAVAIARDDLDKAHAAVAYATGRLTHFQGIVAHLDVLLTQDPKATHPIKYRWLMARRKRAIRKVKYWRGQVRGLKLTVVAKQANLDAAIKALKAWRPPSTTLTMYDSVTVSEIPRDAKAVAGYTSGNWPTFPQLVSQFPNAHKLSIAVSASHDAECLDVEPGDATPAQAAVWVKRQRARGVKRPVVYTSVSSMQSVINNLKAVGLSRADFRVWTAHYTGHPHRCSSACGFGFHDTADATQYWDHALGRNLDVSLCSAGFFS